MEAEEDVDVDVGLLAKVEPDDGSVLGVDVAANFGQGSFETSCSGLATAVDLEAGNPAEVGTSRHGVGKLLNLVEAVGHTGRVSHVSHLAEVSSPGSTDVLRSTSCPCLKNRFEIFGMQLWSNSFEKL